MKPSIWFFLAGLTLFCLSCNPSDQNNATDTDTAVEADPPIEIEAGTPMDTGATGYVLTANYESAAVYAGSVDYTFSFRIKTGIEGEGRQIPMPENMLEESTGDLPGANPELVYKDFKIYFGPDNQVQKIELVEE